MAPVVRIKVHSYRPSVASYSRLAIAQGQAWASPWSVTCKAPSSRQKPHLGGWQPHCPAQSPHWPQALCAPGEAADPVSLELTYQELIGHRECVGHLHLILGCLGWSLPPAPESSFLPVQTPRSSRNGSVIGFLPLTWEISSSGPLQAFGSEL